MYNFTDLIDDYIVTNKDIDFLTSKDRQQAIIRANKANMGDVMNFNKDYSIINGVGNFSRIIIPDLAIAIRGIESEFVRDLAYIKLNKHLSYLADGSLMGRGIRHIVLNEGLKVISDYALSNNEFCELIIPSTVIKLGVASLENSFHGEGELVIRTEYINIAQLKAAIGKQPEGCKLTLVLPNKFKQDRNSREYKLKLHPENMDLKLLDELPYIDNIVFE